MISGNGVHVYKGVCGGEGLALLILSHFLKNPTKVN